MTTEQMRQQLLTVYPGQKWADKVRKMPDSQVIAIFRRFQNDGKL